LHQTTAQGVALFNNKKKVSKKESCLHLSTVMLENSLLLSYPPLAPNYGARGGSFK